MGLETEHGSNKSVLPKQPKQKWDEKGGSGVPGRQTSWFPGDKRTALLPSLRGEDPYLWSFVS